ncbi:hypothetical protein CDA63_13955 [Hymenobacter amundsenii]|uniref:DUF6799 domain-containing protein n=2 Tax=Hymenobacter amundsenii TaxID=2006685 RepID=A0A246FIX7_9BACT|nr:hypothetical protein CDA63_13955 [Hymenobacter amundsenii]
MSALRFFPLALTGLLLAAAPAAKAQTTTAAATSVSPLQLKDGAFRRAGRTYRLLNGQESPLTESLPLADGFELRPDGRLIRNGVTRQLLQNGQAVTMQGNVVLLRDDMLTPAAIAQHDQQVTGGSTTTIAVPAAANLAALVPQFERTVSRLAQLQQLTSLLDQRATSLSAGTAPNAMLDSQIRQLIQQLALK